MPKIKVQHALGDGVTSQQVGERIRARRKALGWSQETLGRELGLTFQQIQKYEKGVNHLNHARLQQMAAVLKVPVSYFFDNLSVPKQAELKALGVAGAADLLAAFAAIPNGTTRTKLVGFIEQLAVDLGEAE